MSKKITLLTFLAMMLFGFGLSYAQDNTAMKINKKLPVSGGEKTDFIFTRSFPVGEMPESVPLNNSRSGIWSFGISYGFPIGKTVEFKLEPRASWHKMYFKPTPAKTFPTSDVSEELIYEKQRAFYVEVPVGFKFKLARNADDKYKFHLEGGFSFGFNAGSTFKSRREVDLDGNGQFESKMTTKVHRIQELNSLRYGPYARIGTNWIAIYGFYRMTDIFDPSKKIGDDTSGTDYPMFPKLELGFSIMI
jgi:hypothetical protein